MALHILNIERGMPTVEQACAALSAGLRSASANRRRAVKIIHGYGSSGKGGAIKKAVAQFLQREKNSGKIKEYISGEKFSPFYQDCRRALDICAEISSDSDFLRENPGITIVIF